MLFLTERTSTTEINEQIIKVMSVTAILIHAIIFFMRCADEKCFMYTKRQ